MGSFSLEALLPRLLVRVEEGPGDREGLERVGLGEVLSRRVGSRRCDMGFWVKINAIGNAADQVDRGS